MAMCHVFEEIDFSYIEELDEEDGPSADEAFRDLCSSVSKFDLALLAPTTIEDIVYDEKNDGGHQEQVLTTTIELVVDEKEDRAGAGSDGDLSVALLSQATPTSGVSDIVHMISEMVVPAKCKKIKQLDGPVDSPNTTDLLDFELEVHGLYNYGDLCPFHIFTQDKVRLTCDVLTRVVLNADYDFSGHYKGKEPKPQFITNPY